MTSLVRKAMLLSVCGLLVASAAMAGLPNKTNSTKSSACLVLVGDYGADAAQLVTGALPSLWTLTVRDGAVIPNVVPFAVVVIDMLGCADIHVATQQSQLGNAILGVPDGFPQVSGSMHVDPLLKTVWTVADAFGVARFVVEGGANANVYTNLPYAAGCAHVKADDQDMGDITITALNRNLTVPPNGVAANAVTAADATIVLLSLLPGPSQPYKAFIDLNCDGASTAADAAIILGHVVLPGVWGLGGPSRTCPPDGTVANTAAGYAW